MNSIERVVGAIMRTPIDRVPVYPILSGVTRKLVGANYKEWSSDSEVCASALIKAAEEFEQDCIVTLIDLSIEADAWGLDLVFEENEAAHPNFNNPVIKSVEEFKTIKAVDYRTSKRMAMHVDVCKKLVERKGKELPVVAFVFGPLGVLSMLRGQQDMYMDIYDEPDLVKEAAAEINKTLKQYCRDLLKTGVSAIMLDTLFASGSIMSKDMWKEFEGGLVKELAEDIRANGGMVMIHNCGQKIYFDAQIEMMQPTAISFLYPPDDCKDYVECKEKYGDKVTLIGCVPPPMVVNGTDEEYAARCKTNIDDMAKGGGFMLATGCEYPANASFNRAKIMVDLAKTYGKYKN